MMEAIEAERLCNATLAGVRGAAMPAYDRSAVTEGIVHLGVGAFHRAHQAVYVDDCLAAGERDWGIAGISLRSPDTRDALSPQDGLYTVVTRSGAGDELRVVGALGVAAGRARGSCGGACAPGGSARPHRHADGHRKGLSARARGRSRRWPPRHRLGRAESGQAAQRPRLSRRRPGYAAQGGCDALHRAVLRQPSRQWRDRAQADAPVRRDEGRRLSAASSPTRSRFPSTMVDRIVPATTDDDRARVSSALGVEDAWPVMTEPFMQWVVEDHFGAGRPRWEASA